MGQFIFFALLIITLMAGTFAYFSPSQKAINPMKFMMDSSGYNSMEAINTKRTQQFNMTTIKGLIKIRRQMDDLAKVQNKYLEMLQNQQQILNNTGKDATDIMLMVQQEGGKGSKDLLQLKALASQMLNEQRLLVANGQDLVALSNQLTKSRQWVADQIDTADINTETSLQMLQQRYALLQSQSSGFFNQSDKYSRGISDQMQKIQDQLNEMANNNAIQQQNIKDRIGYMMGKEHENSLKLADSEDKERQLIKDSQEKLADSQELINDSLQQTQESIEDERQKAEDQQMLIRQRVADQMQRLQDRQNQ